MAMSLPLSSPHHICTFQPRTTSSSPYLLLCINSKHSKRRSLPHKQLCFISAFPILHLHSSVPFPPPSSSSSFSSFSFSSSSTEDIIEREEGMPIPNTVTFRRSSIQKHYEYLTNLEALGMEAFSSDLSRSMAMSMGIEPELNAPPSTTPVCISIDVSKEGRDLRLDGIVRTSIALRCSRCGIPVAERVFGEFSLLLTENPVVEPTKARLGVVLGDDSMTLDEEVDLEDILDLDLDDKLHFPRTEKSIDISKYIRDTVHLEIPLQCLCALSCKGKCIDCGTNLNHDSCKCGLGAYKKNRQLIWGPLRELRKQLESEGTT